MKTVPLLFFLLFLPLGTQLLQAQVVLVNFDTDINIKSESKAEVKVDKTWIVFSEKDIESCWIRLDHGPFHEITDLYLEVKSNGLKTKYYLQDFDDISYSPSYEIDDARQLVFIKHPPAFPCTFHLKYSVKLKGLAYLNDWVPINASNVSIQNATLKVTAPKDLIIHHWEQNIAPPEVVETGKFRSLTWKLESKDAIIYQTFGPSLWKLLPRVSMSPDQFNLAKTSGSNHSWQNLGLWVNELSYKRDKLPREAEEYLKENILPLSNKTQMITEVLEWVRRRTRYVSIQMGIGGYQPAPASEVYKLAYGDCKGLSNLTVSALRFCGIEAYYTLVYSDREVEKCRPEFPTVLAFNHAIVCVPMEEDTLWLECTSDLIPYNYIHSGISGKNGLIVDGENSRLVKIGNEQRQFRNVSTKTQIAFDSNMISRAFINTHYYGRSYEENLNLETQNAEEQKKAIQEELKSNNYNITSQHIKHIPDSATVNISATIELRGNGQLIGEEYYFSPSVYNSRLPYFPEETIRILPVVIPASIHITDTITTKLPEGYLADYLPENIDISTHFGYCKIFYILKDNKVIIISDVYLREGEYEASEYNELRDFNMAAVSYLDRKLILLKQD